MLRSLNEWGMVDIYFLPESLELALIVAGHCDPLPSVSNKLPSPSHLTVFLPKVTNQAEETHPSHSDQPMPSFIKAEPFPSPPDSISSYWMTAVHTLWSYHDITSYFAKALRTF